MSHRQQDDAKTMKRGGHGSWRHPEGLFWVDHAGALHLDIPAMLVAHGYADTPANRATLTEVAVERARKLFPSTPIKVR